MLFFFFLLLLSFQLIPGSSSAAAKSSTLPLPHQRPPVINRDQRDRERDGYYSDRNELIRERERDRDRGYLSDRERYKIYFEFIFFSNSQIRLI